MVSKIKELGTILRRKRIGLLIDGPNMLRKEFNLNLEFLRKRLEEFGSIRVGKVFLNQHAPEKLIEAVSNQGFLPVVLVGDIDVPLAIEAMEMIYNPNIDIIALATRDADFLPILIKAKEVGKETIVIGGDPGFSVALQNAADHVIRIEDLEGGPV